jgi:hypothetical protein
VDDMQTATDPKEYVLLLDALDGGRFTPVSTAQGAYRVEDGHAVASDGKTSP